MEAMRAIVQRLPEWQKQLDEMNDKVRQRQTDLAILESTTPDTAPTLLENHEANDPTVESAGEQASQSPLDLSAQDGSQTTPESTSGDGIIRPSTLPNHQLPATVATDSTRNAEQTTLATSQPPTSPLKRKAPDGDNWSLRSSKMPKDNSEDQPPVYYDSVTQAFFGDLIRYMSGCRNDMRRAEMDAKVAEIKRMAEYDIYGADGLDSTSTLRPMSTRRFQSPMQSSAPSLHSDAIRTIDEQLERIQSACENGAHSALRYGFCHDEISTIQSAMKHITDFVNRHMEAEKSRQAQAPQVQAIPKDKERMAARTRRFISMRRNIAGKDAANMKPETNEATEPDEAAVKAPEADKVPEPLVPTINGVTPGLGQIEVDLGCMSDDAEADLPPVVYRSTRAMRR